MEQEKGMEKNNSQEQEKSWVEKTEAFIDEAADKIHKSESYKKADKSLEKATKSIFRKAGNLWGKSERYFNSQNDKKNKK